MKALLTVMLLLVPTAVSARQGTIRYDRAVKYDFTVPEGMAENLKAMVEAQKVTAMVLTFDRGAWVMKPAPTEEEPPRRVSDTPTPAAITMRLKMGSTSRSDQETLLETWVDPEAGRVLETREFMGRTFLISGPKPTFSWRLTGEQSTFLGYTVQKATALRDSTTVEAWFTTEIPVPAGPATFGGLPGMILVVSIDDGHTTYSATEVNMGGIDEGALRPPEEGDPVTPEEYETIVAEKLRELEATRAGRIRR